jgi:hypothetical protein
MSELSWPGKGWVPLPEQVRRVPRPATQRLRRLPGHLFGRLLVAYRTDQPVYVGVGEPGADGLLAARVDGRLVVTGGCMRRVARARFEAMTRACGPAPRRWITEGAHAGWRVGPEGTPAAFVRCDPQAASPALLCAACALFGTKGVRGRVQVSDFFASEAEAELRPMSGARQGGPAAGEGVAFDEASSQITVQPWPGRLFEGGDGPGDASQTTWVEAIPRGVVLAGEISIDGITPAEMGALLSAFGLAPGSFVKVGRGRDRGFGRLRPANVEWQLQDAEGAAVAPAAGAWRAAHVGGPDYWRAGEVALITLHTQGDW